MTFAAESFVDASELWGWAEPLIHDVLRETYEDAFADADAARKVAFTHAELWRTLSSGEADESIVDRLEAALATVENGVALFNDANAAVVAELADTVRRRYRVSLRSRSTYERALSALGQGFAVGAR
jgi:lipoate synthase